VSDLPSHWRGGAADKERLPSAIYSRVLDISATPAESLLSKRSDVLLDTKNMRASVEDAEKEFFVPSSLTSTK